MIKFKYSTHAIDELKLRNISREMIDAVLSAPQQKTNEHDGIVCYQSKIDYSGSQYLIRIMVNEKKNPLLVVTAYRTSKIAKYWRDNESNL